MSRVVRVARVAAVLAAVALVASGCTGSDGGRTHTAHFSRAVQLFPGVKVKVLGVDVGQVTDVENVRGAVAVRFRLDEDVQIPADVNATLVPVSLLGERYVQLFPAYEGGPELEDGATIPLARTSVPAEGDELLRALQDYLGELDGDTVEEFVTNAATVLEGKGERLNRLIAEGTEVFETLDAKRDELAGMIVQFNEITQALSTRQEAIARLLGSYNVVGRTINDVRASLEGTITGLNDASSALASLLIDHRAPLGADIRALTRTMRTLDKNVESFADTGHWAERLFRAASRAVNYEKRWLRLGNQGGPLFELMAHRLKDRLIGVCYRLELESCQKPGFWEGELPDLLCFDDLCVPRPQDGPARRGARGSGGRDIEGAVDTVERDVREAIERETKKSCRDAENPKRCRKKKREERKDLLDNLEGLDDLVDDVGGAVDDATGGGLGGGL